MVETSRIQEISDRLEIESLLVRYCTAIDTKQFDDLDSVFIPDAFIDYTSAGGVKGKFPEVKKWLSEVLSLFSMTQHSVSNFVIKIEGDHATSRCAFYNPMELAPTEDEKTRKLMFFGGYYNDILIRTDDGWRISQRIEESAWNYGTQAQQPE